MFDWVAEILKYVMIFCDKISFHNYALALFLFALIVKIILFPFSIKQQKNTVKSAQLRPKELAIRKKYKGRTDQQTQQKMTMEIQEMYQKEGYNQFGGCLPLLIQLPVLYSLYAIIQNPLYYVCRFSTAQIETITEAYNRATGYISGVANSTYTAAINVLSYVNKNGAQPIIDHLPKDGIVPEGAVSAGGAAITDWSAFCADIAERLSSPDLPNFNLFGIFDLGKAPNVASGIYLLVPVVVFLAMFATMKIQKKFTYQPMAAEGTPNISMKMMDIMMPALSAFLSYSLPTALALYWVYQNVLGLAQQIVLSKMFPVPKLSDEEIRQIQKEAEKEAAAARKAQAAEKKTNPKRSLHHIDDDEEDIPRRKCDDSMEDDSVFIKNKEKNKKISKAELKDDKKDSDSEE